MPADYLSTAKALALPISPSDSPSPSSQANRPPWSRPVSGRRPAPSPYSPRPGSSLSWKDQILHSADKAQRRIVAAFQSLSLLYKVLVLVAVLLSIVLGVLFLVYSERLFGYLSQAAEKWRDIKGGWMILWSLTFITAFPPIIGYSSTVTIAGFVFGFPNGWFIVASATVVGSLCSFLASRTVLSSYVQRLIGQDRRFEALALTLKYDGLKILCMIRFCPLPYSLSNAAMSTFPTVQPLSFALATLIASPKLLIHVFIGARIGSLAGGDIDTTTKIINYVSIFIGVVLGITCGYIIYQRTLARAKELELEEREAAGGEGGDEADGYFDGAMGLERLHEDDISLHEEDAFDSADYRDAFMDEDDHSLTRGDARETSRASRKQ